MTVTNKEQIKQYVQQAVLLADSLNKALWIQFETGENPSVHIINDEYLKQLDVRNGIDGIGMSQQKVKQQAILIRGNTRNTEKDLPMPESVLQELLRKLGI